MSVSRPTLSASTSASSGTSASTRSSSSTLPVSAPTSPTASRHQSDNPISTIRNLTRTLTAEHIVQPRSRSRSPLPPAAASSVTSQQSRHSPHPAKNRRHPSDPVGATAAAAEAQRKSLIVQKRNQASSVSHCGRHSNEWLFGNISLRETVKHLVRGEEDNR